MHISVISGTFNRLNILQRMVNSVRESIGMGIDYEIVLVDGGSTDGTIEWCKKQSDIKLIEQGKLVGAIKAFNAGAKASTGDYVILANDDIEFIKFSILNAYTYMQDHPDVGIGCFMQDRNNREMHVETMPVIINGKQGSKPYGQVCIVPRWLGDKVGWWGNVGMKTYGGDNELSCNVFESGYKVEILKCSCIHDLQVDDILRDKNDGYPAQMYRSGKPHPDTVKWLKKWRKTRGKLKGMTGPVVATKLKWDNKLVRIPRIYYVPIFEENHPYQRNTKVTLRNELKEIANVFELDYMSESVDRLFDSSHTFKPDMFLLQLQTPFTKLTASVIRELRSDHPNARFMLWNGDYHPVHLYDPDYVEILKLFDMCGFCTTEVGDVYTGIGIKWMYLQAGYEDYPEADWDGVQKRFDVIYLANGYSTNRIEQARVLRAATKCKVGLYGLWKKEFRPDGVTLYDYAKNYLIYKSATFAISDQQWPTAEGYCSDRIFHALRSGVCVLQQWFAGMEDLMGLIDGQNVIVWEDLDHLAYILDNLPNDLIAKKIGISGQSHVISNFQYKHFVQRMLDNLYAKT